MAGVHAVRDAKRASGCASGCRETILVSGIKGRAGQRWRHDGRADSPRKARIAVDMGQAVQ